MEQRLRLKEFKAIYDSLETGTVWIDHLLLGLLVWLEEKVIDVRVKVEVDTAVEDYEKIEPSMPDMVTPVYTETSVDTSTRLPEVRLTAPWYKETKV